MVGGAKFSVLMVLISGPKFPFLGGFLLLAVFCCLLLLLLDDVDAADVAGVVVVVFVGGRKSRRRRGGGVRRWSRGTFRGVVRSTRVVVVEGARAGARRGG